MLVDIATRCQGVGRGVGAREVGLCRIELLYDTKYRSAEPVEHPLSPANKALTLAPSFHVRYSTDMCGCVRYSYGRLTVHSVFVADSPTAWSTLTKSRNAARRRRRPSGDRRPSATAESYSVLRIQLRASSTERGSESVKSGSAKRPASSVEIIPVTRAHVQQMANLRPQRRSLASLRSVLVARISPSLFEYRKSPFFKQRNRIELRIA